MRCRTWSVADGKGRERFGSLDTLVLNAAVPYLGPLEALGLRVQVPAFMAEIVASMSQLARGSSHINQRSGVSVSWLHTQSSVVPVRPPSSP